mmetsp:Transcript_1909/g.4368  ORF Transcript_1909/g.4368 Transcript_1909/m.4368 type:complete len:220 (+) Transcript_1909:155-814(+)
MRFSAHGDTFGDILRLCGGSHGHTGVKDQRLGNWTLLATQRIAQDGGVCLRVAAAQIFERARLDTNIFGLKRVRARTTRGDLDDICRASRSELIQAHRVYDERLLHAELHQRVRHEMLYRSAVHADERVLAVCGVQHRPQQVERRANLQLFAHRRHLGHRRVISRGKHEPHAALFDALHHALRTQLNLHPQRLEHVPRSTQRRHRPRTVFCHLCPGSRG